MYIIVPHVSIQDVVYENGKPVFAILRLLGVLPITRTAPGSTVFKMGSASMAYSAFIFVLILVSSGGVIYYFMGPLNNSDFPPPPPPPQLYVYFVALNRVKIIRNLEGRFEEAIIAYLFLVNLVPIIIIPMMWYEAKKVAQLLNNWSDFEVRNNNPVRSASVALAALASTCDSGRDLDPKENSIWLSGSHKVCIGFVR